MITSGAVLGATVGSALAAVLAPHVEARHLLGVTAGMLLFGGLAASRLGGGEPPKEDAGRAGFVGALVDDAVAPFQRTYPRRVVVRFGGECRVRWLS